MLTIFAKKAQEAKLANPVHVIICKNKLYNNYENKSTKIS